MRSNGGQNLLLRWEESGGPKVRAPAARGFGSTLIEQTLRAHGGEASINYRPDGVTCEIRLPLPNQVRPSIHDQIGSPARGSGPSLLQTQDDRRGLEGKRILIVEDEPLVAMELESNLAAAGCEVIGPAGTLAQAKALVAQRGVDATLVDVNLGGHTVEVIAEGLTTKNTPFRV